MTRLIYFRDEISSEQGIVIDTENRSRETLQAQYGLPVNEIIELDNPCVAWPTDRLLVAESNALP